jgi:Uma2 family endonuclease
MTAIPKPRKLTVAEYFAIEEKTEHRSEFFDGEMFAMAGASREHNVIMRNLVGTLYGQLKGSANELFASHQRVKVESSGLYTYPDLLIVCAPAEYAPENRNTLINPKVVIEVLSPSTERYDRTTKFRFYKKLPSLMEYILVAQDEPVVERYVRQADPSWGRVDFVGLEESLALVSVPAVVPLAEIYRGVEFPPQAAIGSIPTA